jgi:deoxyribose-phosphate aldolase
MPPRRGRDRASISSCRSGPIDGAAGAVDEEIAALLAATAGATRKLILEMGVLTESSLGMVASILNRRLPEMAKTGTAMRGPSRPRTSRPCAVCSTRGSGSRPRGVRTRAHAESLVRAGASRIGTSRPADVLA